jgi:hypothetical protein
MRSSPRNHGRTLWALVALLFAASLALAGWIVLANWVDTSGLTEISQWTPKHIAHDPHDFLRLCQNRINETTQLAESAAAQLARRRKEIAQTVGDAQPELRLATQKRLELLAVYQWAEAAGRWPVRYGNAQYDQQSLKAAIIGTTRYTQALAGVSGQIPRALAAVDARLPKIDAIRRDLPACAGAVRAEMALQTPLSQESVDRLSRLGERIASLRSSLEEAAQPVDVQLPADVPVVSFDESEFARVLAGN